MVILGVGNDLRGDDAAGLEVVRLIRSRAVRSGVAVGERPGDPLGLIEAWSGCAGAVVVDAMRGGSGQPGAIRRHDAGCAPLPAGAVGRGSTHAAGVAEAIELARTLGRLPPRVIVYAVEGARFELGAGLSAPVRAALPALAAAVRAEAVALVPVSPDRRRPPWRR